MALASVATAWCSYQSSAWSGESSDLAAEAAKLQRQTNAQHLEARQIEAIQMREFMEAIDAQMEGNEKLARFYTDRFAEELKPAYEKWIALDPFNNPAAPPHPFVQMLYTPRFEREIREGHTQAALAEKRSRNAGHLASSYLSNTVSLATVLLFAATAEKFEQRRVRWGALAFAVSLFFFAVARMVILPIA
ncbi:MAG TPA: hypothetical protein VFG14_09365 [Chthoniobacteraceae bacterium]|nr:hypothetical protein [Chthoniobacteraceae bacterium]